MPQRLKHFLHICLFCWLTIGVFAPAFGQNKHSISGYIKDRISGEYIAGCNVIVKDLNKGVASNPYGFYSLNLPAGNYTIQYSFIGYDTEELSIELTQDITSNIDLNPSVIMGPEVVIEADRSANTESTDLGKVDLAVEQIKTLPAFLGEVDILKTIQFLPGIQTASEGSSGFYVRGGGPDQNLILLDNATVYNASHLFGFFSVFNADAVKNIEVIKGGMPAQYGGRLASVLNISLNEGNSKELKGTGGIGLIASRFTLEGPIKKDTSSFIISARRTYIDVLTKPFINPESDFSGSGYYFYDLNGKVNWRLSPKDQLYASGYYGRDVFGFKSQQAGFETRIPWGNAIASLRWNHLFNDKLFMSTIGTFSDYSFAFEAIQEDFNFTLSSGIKDWSAKMQLNYYPTLGHEVTGGLDYVFHRFSPGTITARSGDITFDTGSEEINYSHEAAVYVQDEFDLTDRLRFNLGLRYSYFAQVGPFTRYVPNEGTDGVGFLGDTEVIEYTKGDVIQTYGGFEPRASARLLVGRAASIKAGFARNLQYIHLASLSPTSLPTDVWIPSSEIVRPQSGVQYSLGYFQDFIGKVKWEASIEGYYKEMEGLVEYQEGVQPEDNVGDNVDNNLEFGEGTSYGVEFFLKKVTGKWNGWVGYTWSKTDRYFENINNGNPYPAKFDRRHDLSIVCNWDIHPKWKLGAAFVYATGNAITLPLERYFFEGQVVDVYGERNSFRMAPYHRADLSATFTPSRKERSAEGDRRINVQSSWTFSVYNLYNRMNPYFIYFGNDGNLDEGTFAVKAYQVSLFPILPSITWNFSF